MKLDLMKLENEFKDLYKITEFAHKNTLSFNGIKVANLKKDNTIDYVYRANVNKIKRDREIDVAELLGV